MSKFNKIILTGTIWSLGGQMLTLLVGLITNVFLARILSPYEFGQIGIIMFFIILANVFSESGLAGALIRKKDAQHQDYATVFTFNLIISTFCYLILILLSGIIANYYDDHTIKDILIISGLVLIINAFQFVQSARLMKEMKFKTLTKCRFYAVLFSSLIGIVLAFTGFGVWAMVIMQLLSALFATLLFWIYEGVFFSIMWNKNSFKELYGFGINTTLASLLNTAFENVYQLILGRYFSIHQVGFFYQAKRLQEIPIGIINMTTQGVVFSSLSKLQDDRKALIEVYSKIVLLLTVLVGAITIFIFLYSQEIISLLYGKQWLGSVFYIKLLCIASFFYIQEMFSRVIFKVFNETHKILYLEIIKKIIHAITIVIGVLKLDLTILLYGFIITNLASYLINYYFSKRILKIKGLGELTIVLKVIGVAIVTILVLKFAISVFVLKANVSLLTIPLYLFVYLYLLQVIRVINLKKEYQQFRQMLQPI